MDSPTSGGLPGRAVHAVTGVVFCGGKSSRMGEDKALLRGEDGRSMLERACATLRPLVGEVWLACGPRARYGELGLTLVLDRREDGGPLAGLEAVLERATTRWVAVLACDMPRVATAHVQRLLEHAHEADLDACWMETEAGAEPLCAVYSRACLEPVRAALDAGERRMIAFHARPSAGRALRLAGLRPREDGLTQNLNTPSDWKAFLEGTR
ncbi:MAG TPA: molybdenum cofactor guanylyltransferase [Planctomycetota bacterium]|nr:molybdenum cofactor guanylyltransferase [Planctomycetota bacterium]